MGSLTDLLHPSHHARIEAVRELPASDALRFALRRVLYTDDHAEVRAAAARRLDVEEYLLDALADTSPLVRDAILRSLAQCGTLVAAPRLRLLATEDPIWWIRRSAIYALASIAGEAEVATLTRALGDPFWRVRHGAVRVLAVLGASNPTLRDEVIASSDDTTTLAFLRSSWGPVALEAPARAAHADARSSELPPALLDPDPAVVTARLAEMRDVSPRALVELLCDPHVPLRMLAAQRIAESCDQDALLAALDWLEEPRIPHVVDTVHRLLDGLGDAALPIAHRALERNERRGAAHWAIGWTVTTRSEALYAAALARARADLSLRRAALRLADDRELFTWCDDPLLVDAIAVELHERRRKASHDALLAIDSSAHPRVRALQLDTHARRGNLAPITRALSDLHHAPRAVAARWLRADLGADPDPAVREASLSADNAANIYMRDVDPWVRRAAIDVLARAARPVPAAALSDLDPWIRARACSATLDEDLPRLLPLLADRFDMVRAAALDVMTRLSNSDARIRAVLPSLAGTARLMAYSWLSRALDDTAAAAARASLVEESDDRARSFLAAIAGEAAEVARVEVPRVEVPRVEPARVEQRPFGRAGFDVAPLAISGAYDVSAAGLARAFEAGANLFFWEPGYATLGKFVRARARRNRVRIVTGTYHADAASIRADVDRALRALRRDTLDAFLLFWTRSPARIDDEAHRVLDELRRAGKLRAIGFSTHHRELAREAIAQLPWDVVMIRHSAAHPGIESVLLPTAIEKQMAILTFSALCYGRMISGPNAPPAADCYRYSLSQPGVSAVISAPRRYRELVENLAVLSTPTLSAERVAELRAHGRAVHAESARFNELVRQPTRDAAAAARELLASEPPPDDLRQRPMPRPANIKRSRTRLGSPRRR